jgi:hypothetical protein
VLQLVVSRTHDVAGHRPATSCVHCTASCNTQSSSPEDGRNHRLKHVELIGIINKPLVLHLVRVYITSDPVFYSFFICLFHKRYAYKIHLIVH